MKLDGHNTALIASGTLLAFILTLNWLIDSGPFKRWAWPHVVSNEHCHLTADTGSVGIRVYQCDDGYRVEGELKTMSEEGI
jgi:hypothetical protein